MEAAEVATLLAVISQLDNRHITDATVGVWTEMFQSRPDVRLDEAIEAVKEHFRTSHAYLMPVMIFENIRVRRAQIRVGQNIPPAAGRANPSAVPAAIREGLRRMKEAGSDPAHGRTIGPELCGEIMERVIEDLRLRQGIPRRTGTPCGWSGCICTHTEGCEGGWIEREDGQSVEACMYCAPTRRHILGSVPTTMEAGRALRDPARGSR